MAANPATVFWERDIAERFPNAFDEAQQAGLVRRAPAAKEGDRYDRLLGPALTIMAEGDELVGTDEDDSEHVPVSLTELDLQRCRLDLDSFAQWFKRKHGFDGTPLQVHPRFYQLGEITRERTVVLLGLLLPTPQGVDLMAALPAFLSTPFERYLVLCPGRTFGITETRLLQGRGIVALPLGQDFEVNIRDALGPPPRVRPAIILAAE